MPMYVYRCEKCGVPTKKIRKVAEADAELFCEHPVGTKVGLEIGGRQHDRKGFAIDYVAIVPDGTQSDPHATSVVPLPCGGRLIRDVIQDTAFTPYAWK